MTIRSMMEKLGHDVTDVPELVTFKPETVAARATDRQEALEERLVPFYDVVDVSTLPPGPDRLMALAGRLEAAAEAARELCVTVEWDNVPTSAPHPPLDPPCDTPTPAPSPTSTPATTSGTSRWAPRSWMTTTSTGSATTTASTATASGNATTTP